MGEYGFGGSEGSFIKNGIVMDLKFEIARKESCLSLSEMGQIVEY
jgi:hypothetical protein